MGPSAPIAPYPHNVHLIGRAVNIVTVVSRCRVAQLCHESANIITSRGSMNVFLPSGRVTTLNSRVAAITFAVAAFSTLAMTHTAATLAPLKILTLALAAFAAWAFADEMGIRKPLNRAALVCFVVAAGTRILIALGVSDSLAGRYYLLYSAFLLVAILLWSVAFLHRQRGVKWVGAAGFLATLVPISLVLAGHLIVGAGAVFGVGALLAATHGANLADSSFIIVVERIFGLWAYVAAWLLWRGYISSASDTRPADGHVPA